MVMAIKTISMSLYMLTTHRKLKIENISTGEVFEDNADVLISARGSLNDMAWPDIPGLKSYQGELMHSAKWTQKYILLKFHFIV